jgi:hypothetical protein
MKLIAKFIVDEDFDRLESQSVVWEDGTRATLADYRKHDLDTHLLVSNDAGEVERHIFPDIVAAVSFETNVGDWVVRGPSVATAGLEIGDANAPDEVIYASLATFPIVYKARIIRC